MLVPCGTEGKKLITRDELQCPPPHTAGDRSVHNRISANSAAGLVELAGISNSVYAGSGALVGILMR